MTDYPILVRARPGIGLGGCPVPGSQLEYPERSNIHRETPDGPEGGSEPEKGISPQPCGKGPFLDGI